MLVIHGIWAYGTLSLWAEDSAVPARAAPRSGRPSRAPRPHPFAAGLDDLADTVAELAGSASDLARKAVEDELTLRPAQRAGRAAGLTGGGQGGRRRARRPGRAPGAGRVAGARADVRA